MSKIARTSITVPKDITITVLEQENLIKIERQNNSVLYPFNSIVEMQKEDDSISFKLKRDSRTKTARSIVGTVYASIRRAIGDIQSNFTAHIQLKGVGYKATFANNLLTLALGFSHPVKVAIPKDIAVKVNQNVNIELTGIDRRKVMDLATSIRKLRKPEPYKGKGIFVNGETIVLKEGKKK